MGLFDNLVSGQQAANTNAPNTDPVGSYIGNLIDPATAEQYQQARAMQGLLGFFAGAGAASGPSRMPITSGSMLSQGLMNMMQQQNALPDQALKAAQTSNQVSDAGYKRLQGAQLGYQLSQMPAAYKAMDDYINRAGNASPATNAPSGAPTNLMGGSDGGMSGDYADKVVSAELGGAPNDAKNPRSSATGPGQFIDETWLDLAKRNFPGAAQMGDAALLAQRSDPGMAKAMVNAYARDNTAILASAGVPVNDATLYSAHFLGPDGAVKVLTAPASTPLASLLSSKVMAANPNLKGKTAADFASMMSSKMGVNTGSGGSMPPGVPGSPVQLASMNGSAGPDNAAFLAKALGGPAQAAAPSGLQTPSVAAPAAQAGNTNVPSGAGIPSGINMDEIRQAQRLQVAFQRAGMTVPDFIKNQADLGNKIAEAGGTAWAKVGPDIYTKWNVPEMGRPGAQVLVGGTPIYSVPEAVAGVDAQGRPTRQFIAPPINNMGSGLSNPIMQGPAPMMQGPSPSMQGPSPSMQGPSPSMQGPQQTMQGPAPPLQGGPVPFAGNSMLPRQAMAGTGLIPGAPLLGPRGPQIAPSASMAPMGGSAAQTAPGPQAGSNAPPVGPQNADIITGLSPSQQEQFKATGETLGGEYKTVVKQFENAYNAMPNLLALERALQNFRTGPTADMRLDAMRTAQDLASTLFGTNTSDDIKKQIASGEIITKTSTRLGFELANSLGSREAQNIVQQAIKSNPNILNSPQGNEMLVGLIKQGLQRDMDRREFFDNWWQKNHDYSGAAPAFNKAFPLEAYESRAIPYQPKTEAAVKSYKPGTIWLDPKGGTHIVPGGPIEYSFGNQ